MSDPTNVYNTTNTSSFLQSHPVRMDNRDCARLMDYYRIKIERNEWLEKLEDFRISQEDFHNNEWELRKRNDEIYELQNALSETNNNLNTEKRQIINLTAELESCKCKLYFFYFPVKLKEDKVRMIKLIKLAEPIEQTVKLYKDKRPEIFEKFNHLDSDTDNILNLNLTKSVRISSKDNKSLRSHSPNNSLSKGSNYLTNSINSFNTKSFSNSNKNFFNKNSKKNFNDKNTHVGCSKSQNFKSSSKNNYSPRLEMRITPKDEKQQIIRTIVLPEQNITNQNYTNFPSLTGEWDNSQENEFLKKQLIDLKKYYESLIISIEENQKIKDDEYNLKFLNNNKTIDNLMIKNSKLEKNIYEITKEFMQTKFNLTKNEKNLYEDIEKLKLQIEALSVTLSDVTNKFNIEINSTVNDYERKIKELSSVMRQQVKKHEENVSIIKEQYKQIQKIYVSRVKELEGKLSFITDNQKIIISQKNTDNQGYRNEIIIMRKRIKSFENYIVNLRKLTYGINDQTNKIKQNLKSNEDLFSYELNDIYNDLEIIDDKLKNEKVQIRNKSADLKTSKNSLRESKSGRNQNNSNK